LELPVQKGCLSAITITGWLFGISGNYMEHCTILQIRPSSSGTDYLQMLQGISPVNQLILSRGLGKWWTGWSEGNRRAVKVITKCSEVKALLKCVCYQFLKLHNLLLNSTPNCC
jgi:hypothetical protein